MDRAGGAAFAVAAEKSSQMEPLPALGHCGAAAVAAGDTGERDEPGSRSRSNSEGYCHGPDPGHPKRDSGGGQCGQPPVCPGGCRPGAGTAQAAGDRHVYLAGRCCAYAALRRD